MKESVHPFSRVLVLAHPSGNASNKPSDNGWDNAENLDTSRIVSDQYDEGLKPQPLRRF